MQGGSVFSSLEGIDGGRELPLFGGVYVAIVDNDDFEAASQHRWYVRRANSGRSIYAMRNVKAEVGAVSEGLHQFILGPAPAGKIIDHADGDGLNNRRSNLRFCEYQQNGANSIRMPGRSGFRGVSMRSVTSFEASIRTLGRDIYLGCFPTAEAAALAYDKAAREHNGAFARLNFPDPDAAPPTRNASGVTHTDGGDWSDEDIGRLIMAIHRGETYSQIAVTLNRSRSAIASRLKRLRALGIIPG